MREDSCSMSLLQIPWLGMTSCCCSCCCCCCCFFCGPLPIVPIPWCEISSISNWTTTATFRVRRLELEGGSCSDSWLYLSFLSFDRCLLHIGHISNTGRKISTLSNRISPGSRAGCFEKRNAHSGRHFCFV